MGSYIRIKTFGLDSLNNAEYYSFMKTTLNLLPMDEEEEDMPDIESVNRAATGGASAVGISEELIQSMKDDLVLLNDRISEGRAEQETEEASAIDRDRSNLSTYTMTRISTSKKLPLKEEQKSGEVLLPVIRPYTGISRLPLAQKSAQIEGLLSDLRKPENVPHTETLGLTTYINKLEELNNAYIKLTTSRVRSRSVNQKETSEEIRARLDEKYDDLVMLAQSHNVVNPSEESDFFVRDLNQHISDTITAYKLRGKRKDGSEEGGGDRPVIDEDTPEGVE